MYQQSLFSLKKYCEFYLWKFFTIPKSSVAVMNCSFLFFSYALKCKEVTKNITSRNKREENKNKKVCNKKPKSQH